MEKDIPSFNRLIMSQEGFTKNFDIKDGMKLFWTDDKNVELPIRVVPGDNVPIRTIPETFYYTMKKRPQGMAFKLKRKLDPKDKYLTTLKWTWN